MGEQHKITLLRFQKLLTNANFQILRMSHLTTHARHLSGQARKDMAVKTFSAHGYRLKPSPGHYQCRRAHTEPASGGVPAGSGRLQTCFSYRRLFYGQQQ